MTDVPSAHHSCVRRDAPQLSTVKGRPAYAETVRGEENCNRCHVILIYWETEGNLTASDLLVEV